MFLRRLRSANGILVASFVLVVGIATLGAWAPESDRILTPRDVQETLTDASPREGESVHVEGVVTAVSPHGFVFYISAPVSGPWSGVKVEGHGAGRTIGESVVVFADVVEIDSETRLAARRVVSHGTAPVPEPAIVTVADLLTNGEQYEGALVRVLDVTIERLTSRFGEYRFGDATGTNAEVDDEFFTSYQADPGDHSDSITGPLGYGFGDFHVEPCTDADLVRWWSARVFDGLARVTVQDQDGRPLPSKITFLRVDGGPIVLGPEDRVEGSRDVAYLPLGESDVPVPSGVYDVVVSRGIEYGLYRERITVPSGGRADVHATLTREVDTAHWISADSTCTPRPAPRRRFPCPGVSSAWRRRAWSGRSPRTITV